MKKNSFGLDKIKLFLPKYKKNAEEHIIPIKFSNDYKFRLYSYSIMPDHLHLLLEASQDFNISRIIGAIKSKTAHELYKAELLETIFFPNTALHDGGLIINNDKIIAGHAILPLSKENLKDGLGTRHRAGLGITEESDAIALIVSEETGIISIACQAKLKRHIKVDKLGKESYREVSKKLYLKKLK